MLMTRWILRFAAFIGSLTISLVTVIPLRTQPASQEIPVRQSIASIEGKKTQSQNLTVEFKGKWNGDIFSDEANVGRPGKNKLVIRCYEEGAKSYAEIFFYFLSNMGEWKTRMSYVRIEKDPIAVCDPQIKDFNNDGLGDVIFGSNIAARGANELRTLLLYNKKNDSLDVIENSPEYPNLEYNEELDCITAWAFHGATTTIFLRIEGDRLREFASVDTGLERVVTITRRNGQRVVVRREKMNEQDIYTRYSTYDPPTP